MISRGLYRSTKRDFNTMLRTVAKELLRLGNGKDFHRFVGQQRLELFQTTLVEQLVLLALQLRELHLSNDTFALARYIH